MSKSYCTFFPDRIKWTIDYDISFFCALHDELYEEGIDRRVADYLFYYMLNIHYPQYHNLWDLVYMAVRKIGWIFWWKHKIWRMIKDVG